MIADIATIHLVISIILSVFYPIFLYASEDSEKITRYSVIGVFVCVSIAFFLLIYLHISDEFSVLNVFQNSHTNKPFIYKIGAAWGSHESSLLMWIWMLSLYNLFFVLSYNNNKTFKIFVISSQLLIYSLFAIFLLYTSNPFTEIIPIPLEGLGFNPILQDHGLLIHPPMLYMGYIGLSLPFSMTISALVTKIVSNEYYVLLSKYSLISFSFLTIGISLGAWWAYRELGWGGYWIWDPVENASLIPWLLSVSLIHAIVISKKKNIFHNWTHFLSLITFISALFGTFLVRSGIMNSVHSFAIDSSRGESLLIVISIISIISLSIFLYFIQDFKRTQKIYFSSKTFFLLLQNMFFIVSAFVVLLGTLYPLLIEYITSRIIYVNPDFYNKTFNNIMFIALGIMIIAPYLSWQKTRFSINKVMILSMILSLPVPMFFYQHGIIEAIFLYSASLLLISLGISFIKQIWQNHNINMINYRMILSHMGIAIIIIGILLSSILSDDKELYLSPYEHIRIAKYDITFNEVTSIEQKNYEALQLSFLIKNINNSILGKVKPELRYYFVEDVYHVESSILHHFLSDIHVIVGNYNSELGFLVRVYYRPGVSLLWIGTMIIIIGIILSALFNNALKKHT